MIDDEEYVAALLAIMTNPAPAGIDPADPYGQADDGIDRFDGFGRDVTVTGLGLVDGPYGDELEVSFLLALPVGDPEWGGVPPRGSTRVPPLGAGRWISMVALLTVVLLEEASNECSIERMFDLYRISGRLPSIWTQGVSSRCSNSVPCAQPTSRH